MQFLKWAIDKSWQRVTGAFLVSGIIITILACNSEPPPQENKITGDGNRNDQVEGLSDIPVKVKLGPEELARELGANQPVNRDLEDKEDETLALKDTIVHLQKVPNDELKQGAIEALREGDTLKATELLVKTVRTLTMEGEQSVGEASFVWVDIGNIVYLRNSKEGLRAYKKAIDLDPENRNAWVRLCQILPRWGQRDEAFEACEKVLSFAGEDKYLLAVAYGNMGDSYWTKRMDQDKALEMYEKALATNTELGRKQGMANAYEKMGNIYRTKQLNQDKTLEMYEKALAINEELGRTQGVVSVYNNIGDVYLNRSELDKALEVYEKALAASEKLGRTQGMARNYDNTGYVYGIRGDLDKALEMYGKSLAIYEELGRKQRMAHDYNILYIFAIDEDLDKVLKRRGEDLSINEELVRKTGLTTVYGHRSDVQYDEYNRRRRLAIVYGNMGDLYFVGGGLDNALEMYRNVLAIKTIKDGRGSIYGKMGNIYGIRGDVDKALEMHEEALAIVASKDITALSGNSYNIIGNDYLTRWALNKALKMCEKDLAANEELGSKEGIGKAYYNIGNEAVEKPPFEDTVYWQREDSRIKNILLKIKSIINKTRKHK